MSATEPSSHSACQGDATADGISLETPRINASNTATLWGLLCQSTHKTEITTIKTETTPPATVSPALKIPTVKPTRPLSQPPITVVRITGTTAKVPAGKAANGMFCEDSSREMPPPARPNKMRFIDEAWGENAAYRLKKKMITD